MSIRVAEDEDGKEVCHGPLVWWRRGGETYLVPWLPAAV